MYFVARYSKRDSTFRATTATTASGPILAVQLNFSLVAASGRKADGFLAWILDALVRKVALADSGRSESQILRVSTDS